MTSKSITLILVAALALSMPAWAENAAEREAKDRQEIEKLMWTYARALDTENPEAYAATYTPDGQFGTGANATKGTAALTKMIADLRKRAAEQEAKGEKRPAMFHQAMNSFLEFTDKDHAVLHAYWMTVFAGSGPGKDARIAAAGHERNEIVRLNGKWLIKVRDTAGTGD